MTWFGVQRGMANAAVQRTLAIELGLSRLFARVQDAETGQRGYLLTGDEAYLAPHEEASRAVAKDFAELTALIKDATQTETSGGARRSSSTTSFASLRSRSVCVVTARPLRRSPW